MPSRRRGKRDPPTVVEEPAGSESEGKFSLNANYGRLVLRVQFDYVKIVDYWKT